MVRLRRCAATALVLWGLSVLGQFPVPMWAAAAFVQGDAQHVDSNDLTFTMPGTPVDGNCIVIIGSVINASQTMSITEAPSAVNDLGSWTHASAAIHQQAWSFVAASSDAVFKVHPSAAAGTRAVAAEVSGLDCATLDGAFSSNDDNTQPQELSTDITTTAAGSFMLCFVRSSTVADFTASGSLTGIGTGGGGDNTDTGGASLNGLGGYQITGAAGAHDCNFTSGGVNETTVITGVALKASAAANRCCGGPFRGLVSE